MPDSRHAAQKGKQKEISVKNQGTHPCSLVFNIINTDFSAGHIRLKTTAKLGGVDAICTGAEPTDDNGTIAADAQPVITSITIREVEEIEDNGNAEGTAASEGT